MQKITYCLKIRLKSKWTHKQPVPYQQVRMKTLLPIILLLIGGLAHAQVRVGSASKKGYSTNEGIIVKATIIEGDTLPMVYLNTVVVTANRIFANPEDAKIYWRIKRDVKKVYPYAILAEARLKEYNAKLATIQNEKERKRFMKRAEKELKAEFEDELKKLTVNQGKILIKLIDRQTGETSYELVKTLRGSFSAFMWQSLASLFGSSLKTEYDAKEKDKMIEDVIYMIENGEL